MVVTVSPRSPLAARSRRRLAAPAAPMIAAGVIAAVCSLVALTGRSVGFDEAATIAIASQHGQALWNGIAHDGGNMSAYYLLIHVLIAAFGDSELVLRLPSVIAAVATAALVAAIAETLFDRRVAWVASVLTAVSLPLVYWAQTARGYAPMLAFACLGMLAFIRLVRACDEPAAPGAGWWAAVYLVAMVLAAYCAFVAVLIIPAQLVVVARRRRAAGRFLVALASLGACGVPLAILAARRGSGQLFWVPRPNRQVEDQVLQALTGSGLESSFRATFVTIGGWVVTGLAVIALGVLAVRARRRAAATVGLSASAASAGLSASAASASAAAAACDPLAGWGMATVLAWAVLPPALAFLDALVSQPIFLPRNLLVSVPAIAIVLAVGICDRRLPRWAAGAALLVALVIRVVPTVAAYGVSPEPWQQVTAAVLSQSRPGDCVTFYPEDARNPFRYYVARDGALARAPRSVLPDVPWSATTPFVELYRTLTPAEIDAVNSPCTRMWLISSHEGQSSGPAQSQRNLARFNALKRRLERTFGRGTTRTDGYASAIHTELMPGRR